MTETTIADTLKRLNYLIEKKKELIINSSYYSEQRVYEEDNPILFGQARIILENAYNLFPKEKPILNNLSNIKQDGWGKKYIELKKLTLLLDYLLSLISDFNKSETAVDTEEKVFLEARERFSNASKAFKQEDYPSCIAHIHSALERALKKKLKIPPTLKDIKIGPLIGFCIRNKVFPGLEMFLKELDKKANSIDNAFKHQSYQPTKAEALEALSLGESFIAEIENAQPNLQTNFHEELAKSIDFLKL